MSETTIIEVDGSIEQSGRTLLEQTTQAIASKKAIRATDDPGSASSLEHGDRTRPDAWALIEHAPTSFMYADPGLRIVYLNPACRKTLQIVGSYLPINIESVVGSTLDILHRDLAAQQAVLMNPQSLPIKMNIQFGPEAAELLISPIFGANKEYLGPLVTWEVVTERARLLKESESRQVSDREAAEVLSTKVENILDIVNAASQGDLTKVISVSGEDAIGKMGEGLGRFLTDLRRSISQIGENAYNLAAAAEELTTVAVQMASNAAETAQQSQVVSAASEEVSKNVQTVATGTEEMSASIREIAGNASEAARIATQAVAVAKVTNTIVGKLGGSSAEIGKVVKVITAIADQTNLLALNATIEAARAGEAGKGFAVVANEVKELAKETAKATEEISQKIGAIQADTQSAVSAIGEIGSIINKINDIASTIASAVEEQTATTNEMTRNVNEAARGSNEIAENIASVAGAAANTTEGANNAQAAAGELAKMATLLQNLVSKFRC